jgi:hypothetical protein
MKAAITDDDDQRHQLFLQQEARIACSGAIS